MIFGMTRLAFPHVAISLLAILCGMAVLLGLPGSKRLDAWTAFFLATTVLISVTGCFPFHKLLPSHMIGAISLFVLAIAIIARYCKQMAGCWRNIYVISAMMAFYPNVFVLIAQPFVKAPAFHTVDRTQSEPLSLLRNRW
jgi:hypothetical protein